jgi:hypothetical protein
VDRRRDELMTVPQILTDLGGVSRHTFYRWRELDQGPAAFKLPNGELRVGEVTSLRGCGNWRLRREVSRREGLECP